MHSRYIRTTWMLSARTFLKFNDYSLIRMLPASELDELALQIQKRNVFARHARENDFYVQRARSLANHTVIEIHRPDHLIEEAEKVANL